MFVGRGNETSRCRENKHPMGMERGLGWGAKVQLLEVQAVWAEQSSGTHWNIESLKGKKKPGDHYWNIV